MPGRRSIDLIAAAVFAMMGAASLLPIPDGPARVGLALPLLLVAPGYALMMACLPRASLGGAERGLFAVGLSLAACVVLGVALNMTEWGLARQSWVAALVATTAIATVVAWIRRRSTPGSWRSHVVSLPTQRQSLLLALALFVAVGAVVAARIGAAREPMTQVTQLWILPSSETGANSVQLGVRNLESSTITYRLRLTDGGNVLQEWVGIDLKPGDTWEQTAALPAALAPGQRVQALLYRQDAPNAIYREVALTTGN